MDLFQNVDNSIFKDMALSLSLFLLTSSLITILIGRLLNLLRIPNSIVRRSIGFIFLAILYFTFLFFEKWGLFTFD